MLKKSAFATIFVTAYLVLYYILFYAGATETIISAMFAVSPFLVVWMVVTIIKHGKYTGTSLSENQEWGYEDVDLNDRK
jgi:hypothetical protein